MELRIYATRWDRLAVCSLVAVSTITLTHPRPRYLTGCPEGAECLV